MQKSISQIFQDFNNELNELYSKIEIDNFCLMILDELFNISNIEARINRNMILNEEQCSKIIAILNALKLSKPIQYELGVAWFYELKFKVDSSVLIPRQETEELVDLIISENRRSQNIIDIGSGSGCISISLAKNMPDTKISAVDISREALKIASENAQANKVNINFLNRDILNFESFKWDKYDLIVSNPPYITQSEKILMNKNVLDYEPELALFVEDNDPLLFYKKIAEFAEIHLNENGKLYFEINENFGEETCHACLEAGLKNPRLIKDLNKKDRIVIASKE
ncbi:MAG: peptide chain release factor N(5)-glutamine methyltransferase [Marinifilaceae bacterium]|jgi:release factor glutamine methyltransferase|nr:peptide chain release factor N(5)-glutamine methyltransferase [Marinifilaceae bacterium]